MNLFTYGTLMDEGIMSQVAAEILDSEKAILHNYIRKTVRNEVYPAIIPLGNHSVDGIIYFDVSEEAVKRLDKFEGSLYTRLPVTVISLSGKKLDAYSYILAGDAKDFLSELDWSYEDFSEQHRDIFQETYQGYID